MHSEQEIKQVTLDIVEENIQRVFSLDELDSLSIHPAIYIDSEVRQMTLKLTRRRAHQFLGSITIKNPATLWDHFKETCFPTFLLEMFPVKYETKIISAEAFYDRIHLPEDTTEFRIHAVEGSITH